ncbi:MAG: aminotransferase class V-fold PLP-dependent enzyme [Dehalococcoidia bacterium]|nr:aminotransferase class V-fold PLP-dependent enzyme [Dehalococcoidia bacterium]
MALDVQSIRLLFPACQRTIYMNSGFEGPSPATVVKAVQQRLALHSQEGPTSPHVLESGKALEEQAKATIAGMLNASADEIHLTHTTTEGLNIVLHGIPWRLGDEMLTVTIEYPSVMVLAMQVARRYGVKLRLVEISPTEPRASIVAKIAEAITPRTRLIFLSHVHYLNGMCMPAEEICALAKRHGVQVLLDGAQGLGNIPLDLHAMGVDFYATPGHKWLCGPQGTGALYVRKDAIEGLQPTFVSSHAATSWLPTGDWEPNDTSVEKFHLTTSSRPLQAGYMEAITFLQGLGLADIQEHNTLLATAMKQALSKIPNVQVHSPAEPPEATSLVTFSIAGQEPQAIVDALWQERKIVCRAIDPLRGVRLSLHLFNTEQEVAHVADEIRKLTR